MIDQASEETAKAAMKTNVAGIPVQFDRVYARCKLATDPLYPAVLGALKTAPEPDHALLDIGCGIGLLALFLRAHGFKSNIQGVDYDHRKIRSAVGAAERLGIASETAFSVSDARSGLPDHLGHVTILDILQFMPHAEQDDLLIAAASRVGPGGRLVIRSCLGGPNWRFKVTLAGDLLARSVRWMKDAPTEYPTEESLTQVLTKAGLSVRCEPLWGRTPFHNFLIVGTRES